MLSCIIGNKSINSFDYEEAKLREWSNKEMLRCPECNERVIYCKGDYKIPYFKHEVGSECEGNIYYEPMTNEHIEGIRSLYNRLKEIDGIENLEVEKYIKNTRQRPDIYFEYDNQRYCIEYQCSPISTQYNKRHELYELEGIKDIWILGTEKYAFEEYTEEGESIIFKEKKVKAIEDEIDRGNAPLLYYNNLEETLYKVDRNGFKCITRWQGKYEIFKYNILKTKIKLNLDKTKLKDVSINVLTSKKNKNIKTILKETTSDILQIEKMLKKIKDEFSVHVNFKYNLDNDRFPIYKIDLLGNNEFYEGACEIKEFINNYIDYSSSIIPIFNELNNGNYDVCLDKGNVLIKNIDDKLIILHRNIANIIKTYSELGGFYIYDFKLNKLIELIKTSIEIDKNRIIRRCNIEVNMETIKNLISDIESNTVNININYCNNSIDFSYQYITDSLVVSGDSELGYDYLKKIITDKINNVVLKNEEYLKNKVLKNEVYSINNAYMIYIDNDDRFPKTISEIASHYGMSGRKLNEILCDLKIQSKTLKGGFKSSYGITKPKKINYNKWTTYIMWDKAGARIIYRALKNEGILPNIEKVRSVK